MLESGMQEEQKGRVKVEDAEPVILKELLPYLYTGEVQPDFKDYKELMILANRYQVEELVDYTGKKILETLLHQLSVQSAMLQQMLRAATTFTEVAQLAELSTTSESFR